MGSSQHQVPPHSTAGLMSQPSACIFMLQPSMKTKEPGGLGCDTQGEISALTPTAARCSRGAPNSTASVPRVVEGAGMLWGTHQKTLSPLVVLISIYVNTSMTED